MSNYWLDLETSRMFWFESKPVVIKESNIDHAALSGLTDCDKDEGVLYQKLAGHEIMALGYGDQPKFVISFDFMQKFQESVEKALRVETEVRCPSCMQWSKTGMRLLMSCKISRICTSCGWKWNTIE